MKIAVFGGSFDPVHKGHLNIADFVLSEKSADQVIFIPAFYAPHKKDRAFAEFEDRMEMLKLAVRGRSAFQVSDIEKRLNKKPSYTIDTMNALSAEYPKDELIIIIGSDSLMNLHLWHRAEEIAKKWQIITYLRPGFETDKKQLLKYWHSEIAEKLAAGIIKNCPLFDLASSQIRCNISMSGSYEGLDQTVADYIRNKGLYK